jgi:hypothetical protein
MKLLAAAGAGILALIVLVAVQSAGPGASASGVSPALAGAPPGLVAVAFEAGPATGIDPNVLLAIAKVETDWGQVHTEDGRLPRWGEWEFATESRPCAKTIERRRSWRELLAEALGVRPAEIRRWPTAAEWDRSGRRPSSRTFGRHFGGWREAGVNGRRAFAEAR